MSKFIKNKKALEIAWTSILVGALCLFIGLFFATGLNKSFAQVFKFTSPSCTGQCRAMCDLNLEYEDFKGSCKGLTDHCCLPYDTSAPGGANGSQNNGGTTPSTSLCTGKKEGDKCATNQVCDASLTCVDKCSYCANSAAGKIKTSVCGTAIPFNQEFSCKCTEDEYFSLKSGTVKNLAGTTYYSVSGFCSGSKYCCSNLDTKIPEITVSTNLLGTGFIYHWYNNLVVTVSCKDAEENKLGTGCKPGFWYSLTDSTGVCSSALSRYNYVSGNQLTFNAKFVSDNPGYFVDNQITNNIYLCLAVQDNAGHASAIYKSEKPLRYANLPYCNDQCIDVAPCICGNPLKIKLNTNLIHETNDGRACGYCAKSGTFTLADSQISCDDFVNSDTCK